jgi:hypothetical protein
MELDPRWKRWERSLIFRLVDSVNRRADSRRYRNERRVQA